MRKYDILTQYRFDMTHPIWQSYMRNKDGSVKKIWDGKRAADLEAEGLVKLVPGVTDITNLADGYDAFRRGKEWGCKVTVETACEMETFTAETLLMGAHQKMNEPRDLGGALHDVFHMVTTGAIKVESLADDQQKFYATCLSVLKELGIKDYKTEVQFANDRYGGTADLCGASCGLDWKTVTKARKPKPSEVAQVAAYGAQFGWDRAWLVLIDQQKFKPRIYPYDMAALAAGKTVFDMCLDLCNKLGEIEEREIHANADRTRIRSPL